MKERPIPFTAPMIQAILEGRKTQTRRIVKPQPEIRIGHQSWDMGSEIMLWGKRPIIHTIARHGREIMAAKYCPYGQIGDRLWVREGLERSFDENDPWGVTYRADRVVIPGRQWDWIPLSLSARYMPRWASRITLEITDIRVERVQEISEADVLAEGCKYLAYRCAEEMKPCDPEEYSDLWDMINGKTYPWASNPWIWVISFKRVEASQ